MNDEEQTALLVNIQVNQTQSRHIPLARQQLALIFAFHMNAHKTVFSKISTLGGVFENFSLTLDSVFVLPRHTETAVLQKMSTYNGQGIDLIFCLSVV